MNDPCKGCAVYREIGCCHVDGFLCDFPSCSILLEYIEIKESMELTTAPMKEDN